MPFRPSLAVLLASLTSLLACNGRVETIDAKNQRAERAPGTDSNPPPKGSGTQSESAPLLALGYPPSSLTNDAEYIYWSELGGVYRAAKANPVREHLFGESTAPVTLLVDDTYVYATEALRGSIRAWRKADGRLEDILPGECCARALALDSEHLYVGRSSVAFSGGDAGHDGVLVLSKATRQQEGLLRAGASVTAVAVTGKTLFTVEGPPGSSFDVVRSGLEGEESAVVGHASSIPQQLVTDAEEAYWIDSAEGLVSTSGATLYKPSRADRGVSAGIAIVDGFAHVVEGDVAGSGQGGDLGTHLRVPLAGGAAETLGTFHWSAAKGANYRYSGLFLTADADRLYASALWSNNDGSRGDAILTASVRPDL